MKTEEKIEEAYLRKIKSVPNVVLSPEEIKLSFAKIVNRIDLPEQNKGKTKRINFYNSFSFKVACSIALVFSMGLFGYRVFESQKDLEIANLGATVKELLLPDGSKVFLRSSSTITYSANFQKERNLELKGEAIFEVTKDRLHPFTVKTKLGKVTVLGTVFSVRAFPSENFEKTLLKEGSVKLTNKGESNSVLLKPGEDALIHKGSEQIKVGKVKNMERAFAWQSHNFSFDNEALEVILSVVSDAFDKKIAIKDKELSRQRFTLKFNRNESLTRIMDVLSDVAQFKYREENGKILIEK